MKTRIKTAALVALGAAAAAALYLSPFGATAQNSMMMMAAGDGQVWDAFGGNQQAQKYSTATQITPGPTACTRLGLAPMPSGNRLVTRMNNSSGLIISARCRMARMRSRRISRVKARVSEWRFMRTG